MYIHIKNQNGQRNIERNETSTTENSAREPPNYEAAAMYGVESRMMKMR
jgi:hypothetical protein